MNPATYIPIVVLWILIFIMIFNQRKIAVIQKIIKNKKSGGNNEMRELAKRFIGKECLIYAFDSSHQFQGIVKEVAEGALLVENGGKTEAINLDFVIRIREYPRNKKGNKKSVVLD